MLINSNHYYHCYSLKWVNVVSYLNHAQLLHSGAKLPTRQDIANVASSLSDTPLGESRSFSGPELFPAVLSLSTPTHRPGCTMSVVQGVTAEALFKPWTPPPHPELVLHNGNAYLRKVFNLNGKMTVLRSHLKNQDCNI